MLRLPLLLVVLTHPIRTAHVTNTPSFVAKLDRFYEKLEQLNVAPHDTTTESKLDLWQQKLDKLNSLSPDNAYLSDEDEDLLAAMQSWGPLSPDQLDGVAKELQRIRDEREEDRSDYADLDKSDYADDMYYNDGLEVEEDEEPGTSSPSSRLAVAVTPSAIIREEPTFQQTVVSAVDPIAATNARPRILSDELLPSLDRALRDAALSNMKRVHRAGKCLVPQPRWLMVRQLAPAADIVYMPPCVELHRCAPDSGCCNSEAEVCAPIQGAFVAIPFYLHKADGNMSVARMLFYNHTQCACVSRDTLQTTIRSRLRADSDADTDTHTDTHTDTRPPREEERQNDWNAPAQPSKHDQDEDVTAPPQMRRCTCPGQFLASMSETGPCSCVCDWPDLRRRADCLPLARGDEHFGLRDRVCVESGDCAPPACKYGAYDRKVGKCPARKYRRFRYHKRYHPEKTVVV